MELLYESLKKRVEEGKSEDVKVKVRRITKEVERRPVDVRVTIQMMGKVGFYFDITRVETGFRVYFEALKGEEGKLGFHPMRYVDLFTYEKVILFYYNIIKECIGYELRNDRSLRLQHLVGKEDFIKENQLLKEIQKK